LNISRKVASTIDYSLLWQNISEDSIQKRCKEALDYGFFCIACLPVHIASVKREVKNNMNITAAIGFPLGLNTTNTKIYESLEAIDNGANEIDVVMNISWFKDGFYQAVLNELKEITTKVKDKKPDCIVKVIIEAPHLKKDEELQKACELVIESGADYVKTATGFAVGYDKTGTLDYEDEEVSPLGNTGVEVIKKMYNMVGDRIKIKPSGNLTNLEECLYCIENFGIDRIGNDYVPQWIDALQNK